MRVLIAAMFLAVTAVSAQAEASFNCARAGTAVEKTICADENDELASRDSILAELYASLKEEGGSEEILKGQKSWLRERDACGRDVECLNASYDERIAVLAEALGDENGMSGSYGYGAGGETDFGSMFMARMGDGTLKGWISTVSGPTYHLCNVEFENAAQDGSNFVWNDPEQTSDEGNCQVQFDPSQSSMKISSQNCSFYCGARGYFDGDYQRQ